MTAQQLPRSLLLATLGLSLAVVVLGGWAAALKLASLASLPPTEAAVQEWNAVAATDPNDDGARAAHGLALLAAERPEQARQAFEEVLEVNPGNWTALTQLGLLLREQAPARADELLSRAGELAPRTRRASPLVALGDLRLARGDAVGAREAFEDAVADVPFVIDAHVGLAQALERLGEAGEALHHYQRALRFAPDDEQLRAAVERLGGGDPEPSSDRTEPIES
jgi:tetratricopeptide (TPR) repeat protein